MPPKVTYRIDAGKKTQLLTIAIMADGIQFLFKLLWLTAILAILSEAIGWMVAALGYMLITLICLGARVSVGGKRAVLGIVGIFVECVPLLNLLPALTVWTYLLIRQSRAEDRAKAEASATIEHREAALRRGALRPTRSESPGTRLNRPMRRVLRSIPHPVFRAAGSVRAKRPPEPRAPKKNAS